MTAIEERVILKEKKELENSLPLIAEVEEKDETAKLVKEKKKVLGKKIHDKIEEKNKLSAKIDAVKEKQRTERGEEAPKEEVKKEDKPKHPLTIKIEKIKDEIEKLRATKGTTKDDHEKHYQSWRDQNELEQKIKWIRNKQQYLKRKKQEADYENTLKEEEEKRKAEVEEYVKLYGKPKKYQPQIDVCDNLLSFLESLKPKDAEIAVEQDVEYVEKDVEGKLTSGDWKKEKVHILKKEHEDRGIQPGMGKKKGKGAKKNKGNTKDEDTKLTLTMQTLEYFDQIKVSPPCFLKDIIAVLKELEEKKAYFTKISEDLNDGKPVETEEPKKEEPKEEQEEKPQPKQQKKSKVNLDDEDMFPSMGC